MLKILAFTFITVLLTLLQPTITTKVKQNYILERVYDRLEVLQNALNVLNAKTELLEYKAKDLLRPVAENNKPLLTCYDEHQNILGIVLNETETIRLKQNEIIKHLTDLEENLKLNFNTNENESGTLNQKKDMMEMEEVQTPKTKPAVNVNNDLADTLKEVLLKQNNLEAVFQLILEKSDGNSATDFIQKQFEELKSFINSTAFTNKAETQPQQEFPLHDKHLNCLNNCDDQTKIFDNCSMALQSNGCNEGVYLLQIPKSDLAPFYAYCTHDEWLIIQRREDGTVDFYRNWNDYKNGFGDVYNEYWLGLDRLHAITNGEQNELIVVMGDYAGSQTEANYQDFSIGTEDNGYTLNISSCTGTATDVLMHNNGAHFSTYDRDNDNETINCARSLKGGWWFKNCDGSNLNGRYLSYENSASQHGIIWDNSQSLRSVYMAVRPILRSSNCESR